MIKSNAINTYLKNQASLDLLGLLPVDLLMMEKAHSLGECFMNLR